YAYSMVNRQDFPYSLGSPEIRRPPLQAGIIFDGTKLPIERSRPKTTTDGRKLLFPVLFDQPKNQNRARHSLRLDKLNQHRLDCQHLRRVRVPRPARRVTRLARSVAGEAAPPARVRVQPAPGSISPSQINGRPAKGRPSNRHRDARANYLPRIRVRRILRSRDFA